MSSNLTFFSIFMIIIIVSVFIWSLVWVYKDAEARGKKGILVVIVVACISWPVSLLLWMLIRPEMKKE